MVNKCAVAGCASRVLLHQPQTNEVSRKWKQAIKYEGEVTNYKRLKICSDHFSPEDYQRDLRSELMGCPARKKRRLLESAIPSIHLGKSDGF